KRAFMPFGGIRMAEQACTTNGYTSNPEFHKIFTEYHQTHSDAVFSVYTPEMKKCRHAHILTGLPDTYSRGRIVGDYRRVALYGIDFLIEEKQKDLANCGDGTMYENIVRNREEIAMQIKALKDMKKMAESYGYDISQPAKNAHEAVQWLYFGYLAAIKTQNGAAMSVGRISTFLDIYIKRDIDTGIITESEAQELIDHLVMKFRMVKFARIPSYNQLFSGDPVWATLEMGGIGMDGRPLVTKTDFRFLHTLENMGPSPEPNLTVLYSSKLPENFKKYSADISIRTSSVQYENDDVMKPVWGDDYSICCCVSATKTGKEIQYFGARVNLAKCLLYAINGGVDEKELSQVGPRYAPITSEYLDYNEVCDKFLDMMKWLAGVYVNVLNLIHYMHDKYYYEAAEMALIDTVIERSFATGIAGFSHVVDSLCAIKYAKVKTVRSEQGIVVDYITEGDFPKYGNDDDRADEMAVWLLKTFIDMVKTHHTYRDSHPSTSILTITSNVVYGEATGATPDGRKAWQPFAPGANPSYSAEQNGLLASLRSVAKLPYIWALDGISNTQTISPDALGHSEKERIDNLVSVMDGYFDEGAHHLNVNVFGTEKLIDCMEHPEKEEYANFTIRVSGYAVKFINLTRKQQLDVIARTCHHKL
ncbi:MAG: formate C-acetyltransferase, partial [Clostridia bacterium]|nr:formate C-acetyltransferase [Clostridia bacterium]